MSYEYNLLLNQNISKDILSKLSGIMLRDDVFEIIDTKENYLSCIFKHEKNNPTLQRWGGNFIIAFENNRLYLTINTGNRKDILNKLSEYFEAINNNVSFEDIE